MRATLCALLVGVLLAGCAGTTQPATEADGVHVEDAWVKAADHGMTAAFAHLNNDADREARITAARTGAAARVELHEVVRDGGAQTMRPKNGGIPLPAHSDTTLAPGSDHLMLMDLAAPLMPGSDIEIVATFADGSTLPIIAQVREFPGADEHYGGGGHG